MKYKSKKIIPELTNYGNGMKGWYVYDENRKGEFVKLVNVYGAMEFYRYGVYHRVYGPAVIPQYNSMQWWIEGHQLDSSKCRDLLYLPKNKLPLHLYEPKPYDLIIKYRLGMITTYFTESMYAA